MTVTPPGFNSPAYIVVEGPIGVGKTSLAKRLAESFSSSTLLEQPEDNPFLGNFYQDRKSTALPAQLCFLFQRSKQLESLQQGDLFQERIVSDFMFEKDRMFAELNLDSNELALYEQVANNMSMVLPRPDLVIYLQAPVEVLQARITKRGRAGESGIENDYLNRLSSAYTSFFHHYEKSPLLMVNVAQINPIDHEPDYEMLLQRICTLGPGKHFFNPISLLE